MIRIVSLSASPSSASRTQFLLSWIGKRLASPAVDLVQINLRELPADELLAIAPAREEILQCIDRIVQADVVIVATPIYKAAYTGLLKAILDLLPQNALANKIVLPLASAGGSAHYLALDYALKPVLSALGARNVLGGIFASESDLPGTAGQFSISDSLCNRLVAALGELKQALAFAGNAHAVVFDNDHALCDCRA
jgi:FMN reductase